MNTMSSPAPTSENRWFGGVMLIAIGFVLLVAQAFQPADAGWIVLGTISGVFIAAYAFTRKPGWLIPGAIIGGLAVGVGLEDAGYSINGSAVLIGLSAGFIAIFVVNALTGMPAKWWPLIPGGILGTIGVSQAIGGTPAAEFVAQWWPLVLILAGVIALLGARQREPMR